MDVVAVMKAKVYVRVTHTVYYEWFIIRHPLRPREEVTRAEAMELIEDKGLVKVVDNPDGCIWDSPDRAFRKRFRGILANRNKKSLFEEIWA